MNRIQKASGARLFVIRQARAGDHDAIRDFLACLSPRTSYLRFFTGAPGRTAAMLRLLAGDGPGLDVVLAIHGGIIVGHAMAADAVGRHGARAADIGVVVTDGWQGRGVGSALVRALTGRALDRDISALAMDVLPENRRVLAMIARRWPEASYDRSDDYLTVEAPLRPAPARPALAVPAAIAAGVREPGIRATA